MRDEKQARRLLDLYRRILKYKQVSLDNSPDQNELILSGLVVKENGNARIASLIYEQVFNVDWLSKVLATLKPYAEAMNAWKESGFQDDSRLLRGQALRDALIWAEGKSLEVIDANFLKKSQELAEVFFLNAAETSSQSNQAKLDEWLKKHEKRLDKLTLNPRSLISDIQTWTADNLDLFKFIISKFVQVSPGPVVLEKVSTTVQTVIQTHIIQPWENQLTLKEEEKIARQRLEIPNCLDSVVDLILRPDKKDQILTIYKSVLNNEDIILDDRPALMILLQSGLITVDNRKLKVANRIFESCFSSTWVEHELTKVTEGLRIKGRYKITAELSATDLVATYQVKDLDHPEEKSFIATRFSPAAYIENDNEKIFNDIREAFISNIKNLGKVYHKESMPDLIATFEDDKEFYIVQELIEGTPLNDLISHSHPCEQSQVLDLLIEILEVLAPTHEANIKHLNLHPGCFKHRTSIAFLSCLEYSNNSG